MPPIASLTTSLGHAQLLVARARVLLLLETSVRGHVWSALVRVCAALGIAVEKLRATCKGCAYGINTTRSRNDDRDPEDVS